MDRGIWAIAYGIPAEYRSEYLEWFHGVHIPEKLARPGYRWAAHYQLNPDNSGATNYLALFGGDNAYTFLNPSPRQLLTRQTPETKRFMTMRRDSSAWIFTEAMRTDGGSPARDADAAPAIELQVFNAQDAIAEDETGAWLAQEMFPAFARSSACGRARALVATVGTHKHAWLLEFASNAAREQAPPSAAGLKAALSQAPRSPMTGERIWPPLSA